MAAPKSFHYFSITLNTRGVESAITKGGGGESGAMVVKWRRRSADTHTWP